MKRLMLLGLTVALLNIAVRGQDKDSIYLYNGQVLIGDVQSASLGVVTIDDIDLKMQNIKLYKIRRFRSRQVFKIETLDKRVFYGKVTAGGKDGQVMILAENAPDIAMDILNIHELILLDRNFFKRLDGSLSAGFSYARSSGIGQVNLSTTVGFATKSFQYQLQGSEIGSIDSSKFSRDNESLQFFAGYELTPTWFLAGVLQYQRNLELSIGRRFSELAGGGKKLVIKDSWQLMAISGLSFTQELSTEGVASPTQLELPLMFRFNFYRFHHPNIQITTSQTVYYSLTETGRIRYDGSTSFSWELIRYFYLDINPYSSFDSKPPSGNGHTFDFGIAVSVSYKF